MESTRATARFEGISIDVSGASQTAVADSNLLRRVVVNLLNNAIKFSAEGGKVTVNIGRNGRAVRVAVIDEGPGIPVEYREQIFEKFGQVEARRNRAKHSIGLGLTFCRLAVEAHGGRIDVESEVGKGSTFWFEIP